MVLEINKVDERRLRTRYKCTNLRGATHNQGRKCGDVRVFEPSSFVHTGTRLEMEGSRHLDAHRMSTPGMIKL